MTFSSEKDNIASEKFYLARLNPARDNTDDWVFISGQDYESIFPYKVSKVLQSGNETSFTQSGTTISITTGAAPDSDNPITVFYYIFYTSDRHRVIGVDPEAPGTDVQDWSPRMATEIQTTESIQNVLNGRLTIASSPFSIVNTDNDFGQYLTALDSFNNKDVVIWLCIDDVTNIKKVFEGLTANITLSRNKVNFALKNGLAKLRQPAYMGDQPNFVHHTDSNVDPNRDGTVHKYILGPESHYNNIKEPTDGTGANLNIVYIDELERATCISFSPLVNSAFNRIWAICRTSSNGFRSFSGVAGTWTTGTVTVSFFYTFSFTTSNPGIKMGDQCRIFTGVGDGDFICTRVNGTTSVNFGLASAGASGTVSTALNLSESATLSSHAVSSLVIEERSGGAKFYPSFTHYSESVIIIPGSLNNNRKVEITFVGGFEFEITGLEALNPQSHNLSYRVRIEVGDKHKHGALLLGMMDSIGLPPDFSSFTAADAALPIKVSFSIPNFSQDRFGSYLDYSEQVTRSTLGYLTVNADNKIVYNLLDNPGTASDPLDNNLLVGETSINVEYQDLVTKVIASNPHDTQVSSESVEDTRLKALHGVENTFRFDHVLVDISARLPAILAVQAQQKTTYTMATKSINLLDAVGDDLTLANDRLLGGVSTKNLLITSLSKGAKETKIKAIDLPTI